MNNGGLILTNICGQAWKGWTHTTIPSSPIYTTIDLWLSNPVYLYHSWPMLTYMAYTFPIRPYILTTHNVPSNFPWFHIMSRLKVQLFPPPPASARPSAAPPPHGRCAPSTAHRARCSARWRRRRSCTRRPAAPNGHAPRRQGAGRACPGAKLESQKIVCVYNIWYNMHNL